MLSFSVNLPDGVDRPQPNRIDVESLFAWRICFDVNQHTKVSRTNLSIAALIAAFVNPRIDLVEVGLLKPVGVAIFFFVPR